MINIPKTQEEFLTATINHFTLDNRGYDSVDDRCYYSKGCAIGRYCDPDTNDVLDSARFSIMHDGVFSKLPTGLQSLGQSFLYDVQRLHDDINNWSDDGLTKEGVKHVAYIIKQNELNHDLIKYKRDTV